MKNVVLISHIYLIDSCDSTTFIIGKREITDKKVHILHLSKVLYKSQIHKKFITNQLGFTNSNLTSNNDL